MPLIRPENQSAKENYKCMIGTVLPRPIAFITSTRDGKVINAAPFSFYNVVCTNPPMLGISIARVEGGMKDTARNVVENEELVIHVVDENNFRQVNECSINYPANKSEVDYSGLTLEDSSLVKVPKIKEARVAMECRLMQHLPLGPTDGEPSCDYIIVKVLGFNIDDSLYSDGKIDTGKLGPVGRLAGVEYTTIGERIPIPRPVYEENNND